MNRTFCVLLIIITTVLVPRRCHAVREYASPAEREMFGKWIYEVKDLRTAAAHGRTDMVELFLEAGEYTEQINRSLIEAAERGFTDTVRILLASPYSNPNFYLGLPLLQAIQGLHFDAVSALLDSPKKRADPNIGAGEPLTEAIAAGSLRMVRLLAHYGADLRILDDRPLREAVRLTKIDICQYLLIEGKADVNARSGAALKIASKIGNVQMVNLLLSFHADPRVDESAALCDAVQNDRILISLQLLTTGADANAQNGRPLKTAAVTGNLPLIRALLQFGANPSIDNNGALTLACEAGKTEAFMMLAGADGVDLSLGGDAMLRAAKRLGNWELIRFLESKLRSENHQHQQEEQSYSPQGGSEKLLIPKFPIGAPLSVLSPIPENKDDSAYRRVVGQKFQRPDGLRLQPVFSRS